MDTCGPLLVDNAKKYVLVATDLVMRVVDLELLNDMISQELFHAYHRIVARHTKPLLVLSDNAPQFKALNTVVTANTRGKFSWKFIPAHSPWEGGAYESIVKMMKKSILRTFHNQALSDSEMRTALAEIASILNECPLTYVTDSEGVFPLMPNHFIKSAVFEPKEIVTTTNHTRTRTADQLIHIYKRSLEMSS